jgi:EmrB/QacA subfamily drug resistance transporter
MDGTNRLSGHPWLVLATVMVGTLLIGLDRTVVNLAMPKIISDFGLTVTLAGWIATAYIISNAVFIPVFGKLGDLIGNRVIYQWTFVGFIIVSLFAGFSWDFSSLITFRFIQGLVGAAVLPTAMSLIAKSFTDRKARATALGIWSSSFAVSAVIGPLLGGWLVDNFSWRAVFYINLPIGIIGLLMTLAFIPIDRPEDHGTFDWFGAVLLTGVVSSAVLVLSEGQTWGWASLASSLCYLGAVVFGWLTYRWETRHAHPIINFDLLKDSSIVSILVVSFIATCGLMGSMFLLPIFTQTFLGFDATQSGLVLTPMALVLPLFSLVGAQLSYRFGARPTVALGMFVSALGLYSLHGLDPAMTASAFILPLMLFGAGLGLVMPPLTNAMTTAVPLREVGMSSGLLNLVRNVGGAFGIAAFGTLLTNATNANVLSVAEHTVVHTTAPATLALVHSLVILKADVLAYGTVFAWSSLALVAGGVIAIFFLHVRGYGDEVPPETRAEAAAG